MYIFLNLLYGSNDINYTALLVFLLSSTNYFCKTSWYNILCRTFIHLKPANDMLLGNLLFVRLTSKPFLFLQVYHSQGHGAALMSLIA